MQNQSLDHKNASIYNMINQAKPRIVIAEDDKDLAAIIAMHLELAGMQSQICNEEYYNVPRYR